MFHFVSWMWFSLVNDKTSPLPTKFDFPNGHRCPAKQPFAFKQLEFRRCRRVKNDRNVSWTVFTFDWSLDGIPILVEMDDGRIDNLLCFVRFDDRAHDSLAQCCGLRFSSIATLSIIFNILLLACRCLTSQWLIEWSSFRRFLDKWIVHGDSFKWAIVGEASFDLWFFCEFRNDVGLF